MIELIVYGTPGPQGSKSFKGMSREGRAILAESSKKVKPWRKAIVDTFLLGHREKVSGPVYCEMHFTLVKPASAPKRTTSYPSVRPDLSKLIRATEDALTNAGAWDDDARVISISATKNYPGESFLALDRPGVRITIGTYARP